MNHTYERIRNKPTDYKLCLSCNNINWYENKICWFCGSSDFGDTEKGIYDSVEDFISLGTTVTSKTEMLNLITEV